MHKILLKGRGIEHAYKEGKIETSVLKGVDLDIEASKMTAIVGKSGSGKSTLLHILGTLDTPDKGDIRFQNVSIMDMSSREKARFRNRHLGFVYQFHHLLSDFSALENVMLPLLIDNVRRSFAEHRARYLLERMGLSSVCMHLPGEMSGGERQRVAIARALVYSPDLVLADEPTGNLDENNANIVFNMFRELVRDEGAAVVMVTHDKSLAQQCDNLFEMSGGIILNGTFPDGESVIDTDSRNLSGNSRLASKASWINVEQGGDSWTDTQVSSHRSAAAVEAAAAAAVTAATASAGAAGVAQAAEELQAEDNAIVEFRSDRKGIEASTIPSTYRISEETAQREKLLWQQHYETEHTHEADPDSVPELAAAAATVASDDMAGSVRVSADSSTVSARGAAGKQSGQAGSLGHGGNEVMVGQAGTDNECRAVIFDASKREK